MTAVLTIHIRKQLFETDLSLTKIEQDSLTIITQKDKLTHTKAVAMCQPYKCTYNKFPPETGNMLLNNMLLNILLDASHGNALTMTRKPLHLY